MNVLCILESEKPCRQVYVLCLLEIEKINSLFPTNYVLYI